MTTLGGIRVDFRKLDYAQPALARIVREKTKYYRDGFYIVDLDGLGDSILAQTLKLWVERQQENMPDPPPPPKPAPTEPQINMAELEREQKAQIDTRGAMARLDAWVADGNLEPSDYNLALIRDWFNKNAGGYFSSDGVDLAIQALGPQGSNRLRWLALAPPPPPPPTEPQEVLESWQLKIDASEREMKQASVKALLDLNKRRRQLTGQVYTDGSARFHGSFSSKF